MVEAQSHRIKMLDCREVVIKALLAYLYTFDVEIPSKDSELALELLQIGHKYEIKELERAMSELLRNKPNSQFRVGIAIRLFCFARRIANGEKLKEKAVRVLRT